MFRHFIFSPRLRNHENQTCRFVLNEAVQKYEKYFLEDDEPVFYYVLSSVRLKSCFCIVRI